MATTRKPRPSTARQELANLRGIHDEALRALVSEREKNEVLRTNNDRLTERVAELRRTIDARPITEPAMLQNVGEISVDSRPLPVSHTVSIQFTNSGSGNMSVGSVDRVDTRIPPHVQIPVVTSL